MEILYFTKGERGSVCLAAILKNGYEIKAVIGVVPEEAIDHLSKEYGFPVLYLDQVNSSESVQKLREFDADLFILCGYNKIIKQQVIEIPPMGTINLHGGKLPEFRGAAPINWQIIHGETTGGCSIIYVDEGIDTEEIYPITPEDTHASVLEKTLIIFPKLLLEVLEQIKSDTVNAVPQDPEEGGYYGRRYPHDSLINWETMTDIQVHNLIRAMHGPYPSAYTFMDGKKIEIEKSALLEDTHTGNPGKITEIRENGVIVQASNRGLLIEDIIVTGESRDPGEFFKIGKCLKSDQEEDIHE